MADRQAVLEAAVGRPLEWDQIVPFFGRREITEGAVYSYYEFKSPTPLSDEEWRAMVDDAPRVPWLRPYLANRMNKCEDRSPF